MFLPGEIMLPTHRRHGPSWKLLGQRNHIPIVYLSYKRTIINNNNYTYGNATLTTQVLSLLSQQCSEFLRDHHLLGQQQVIRFLKFSPLSQPRSLPARFILRLPPIHIR